MKPKPIVFALLALILTVPAWAEEAEKKEVEWSSSLNLGYTLTSGNSETQSAIGKGELGRSGLRTDLAFGAAVNYGTTKYTTEEIETTNNWSVSGSLDAFYSEAKRLYGTGRVTHLSDPFQGFWGKTQAEAGLGYSWFGGDDPKLKTELGYALFYYQYVNENEDGDDTDQTNNAFARLKYENPIGKTATVTQEAVYYVDFDDDQEYEIESVTGLSVSFGERFALKTSLTLKYRNRPLPVVDRDVTGAEIVDDDTGEKVLVPADRLDTIWSTTLVITLM